LQGHRIARVAEYITGSGYRAAGAQRRQRRCRKPWHPCRNPLNRLGSLALSPPCRTKNRPGVPSQS